MTSSPNDEREKDTHSVPEYPESPVPGDETLDVGELPFTAFGQFGEGSLDIRVFEQDKYWVNIKGKPFLLEEMDREYLLNVMKFLFDSVEYFYVTSLQKTIIEVFFDTISGKINPEILAVQTNNSIVDVSPTEWLNSTPLVRKISKLLEW